jgi:exodeoxyribonuclease VII large subunit
MDQKYTLSELQLHIRAELSSSFPASYWIIAEIGEMNTNYSGHCYLELIERNEEDSSISSKIRATIWAHSFNMLRPYFETTTNQTLQKGLKVLVKATVEYHILYGISLNIKDIEPNFTIGDQQRKRLEIIAKLESDGIIDMNKQFEIPEIPKKIAIISSKTAAGYEDFVNQLDNNSYGYKFHYKLFQASMQGESAEQSIIEALDNISYYADFFDLVVIIRGGGSKSDLSCFDNYWLCFNIAQFPLPVITGIGHERDESIADIVAHTSLKTPTAVAEFLIHKYSEFEQKIISYKDIIIDIAEDMIIEGKNRCLGFCESLKYKSNAIVNNEKSKLHSKLIKTKYLTKEQVYINKNKLFEVHNFVKSDVGIIISKRKNDLSKIILDVKQLSKNNLQKNNLSILNYKTILKSVSNIKLVEARHTASLLQIKNNLLNPENLLERGYSISTDINGNIIKSTKQIEVGEEIITKMKDGDLGSIVKYIKKDKKNA